jgi:DNA-binding transcriptional regulator YiaG
MALDMRCFHGRMPAMKTRTQNATTDIVLPAQIRAGRAMLDWSQDELATAAQIGVSTVRDFESQRRLSPVEGLPAMKRALENEGILFLPGNDDGGPGVRLAARQPNIIRKPIKMNPYYQLPFAVEWRGNQVIVLLAREILDDLARARQRMTDAEYVAIFEAHRASILDAVAAAIDAGRVENGKLMLTGRDIPELR